MTASQYRDGVFSAASPAPRYGSLTSVFENGSLGGLEEDATELLNPVLGAFTVEMAVTTKALRSSASAAATTAGAASVNMAKAAADLSDINDKLSMSLAACYAATHFGLRPGPQDRLMAAIGQVADMFAMTSNQRVALHQQAMKFYKSFIKQQEDLQRRDAALLAKGNVMSGVFRDGVLGAAFRDGVLGHAYQDGVLGDAYRDGSLGALTEAQLARNAKRMGPGVPGKNPCWTVNKLGNRVPLPCPARTIVQNRQVRDGSLGATHFFRPSAVPVSYAATPSLTTSAQPYFFRDSRARAKKRRAVSGLGCGCAGVGALEDSGTLKTVALYGGAALALGLVFYAVKRK